MIKYYRVIKDNPLWEKGAILSNEHNESGYSPVEDIWNKHEVEDEYLSTEIIEESPDFFKRVYKTGLAKVVYKTAEEFKKTFEKFKK